MIFFFYYVIIMYIVYLAGCYTKCCTKTMALAISIRMINLLRTSNNNIQLHSHGRKLEMGGPTRLID